MSVTDDILYMQQQYGKVRYTLTLQQLRDLLDIHAGVATEFKEGVDLHAMGLIEGFSGKEGSAHLRLTARGQAYVQHILRTPLPEALWVVPSLEALRE